MPDQHDAKSGFWAPVQDHPIGYPDHGGYIVCTFCGEHLEFDAVAHWHPHSDRCECGLPQGNHRC